MLFWLWLDITHHSWIIESTGIQRDEATNALGYCHYTRVLLACRLCSTPYIDSPRVVLAQATDPLQYTNVSSSDQMCCCAHVLFQGGPFVDVVGILESGPRSAACPYDPWIVCVLNEGEQVEEDEVVLCYSQSVHRDPAKMFAN